MLEYYSGELSGSSCEWNLKLINLRAGILILTTNQIAQFDIAVHSRIHVAIQYNALNKDQSQQIFKNFLDPLKERDLVQDSAAIEEWLETDVLRFKLDGRQIRNVMMSALSLARARRARKLELRHLKEVVLNMDDFKQEFVKQYERYLSLQKGTSLGS